MPVLIIQGTNDIQVEVKDAKILQKVKIFSHNNASTIAKIVSKMELEEYKVGNTICKFGEKGDKFYIIMSGEIKILVILLLH